MLLVSRLCVALTMDSQKRVSIAKLLKSDNSLKKYFKAAKNALGFI